jgi:hypothetical protein
VLSRAGAASTQARTPSRHGDGPSLIHSRVEGLGLLPLPAPISATPPPSLSGSTSADGGLPQTRASARAGPTGKSPGLTLPGPTPDRLQRPTLKLNWAVKRRFKLPSAELYGVLFTGTIFNHGTGSTRLKAACGSTVSNQSTDIQLSRSESDGPFGSS